MKTSTRRLPVTTKVIYHIDDRSKLTWAPGVTSGRISLPFARLALFVVYFWFGILKLVGVSPAGPLVSALWIKTIPFIPLPTFIVLFSAYEMLIGVLFLIPKLERPAIALLLMHISMTAMPLVLLRRIVWQNFMVPTLEGQYIIKNLVIVALALSIGASLGGGRGEVYRRSGINRPSIP